MDIYEEVVRLRRLGQKCALATIVQVNGSIPSYESAKLLVREDGSMIGTVGGGCVEAEVWNAAREVMETERPRQMNFSLGQDAAYDNGLICGGQLSVFVEPVVPQPRVFIFGAGHISKSISKVAVLAGFASVVVDNREAFANRERFPEADEVYAEEYEEVFPKLPIRDTSYLVIVTRGHRDDMRVLRWAVETNAKYIAMIGSKRKVIGVVKELEKEGIARAAFERVFAPMGLEIGAITPEEIAVSVVAEMIAVRRAPDSEWRSAAKSDLCQRSVASHPKVRPGESNRRHHSFRRRFPPHGHSQSAAPISERNVPRPADSRVLGGLRSDDRCGRAARGSDSLRASSAAARFSSP